MHLSGVLKVLYNTVLWLCECSGLESALSPKCLASCYLYHILKSVVPCHYSCFLCGCSSDNVIQVLFLLVVSLVALQSAPSPCSRPCHLAVGPITLQLSILSPITRHGVHEVSGAFCLKYYNHNGNIRQKHEE